MLMLLRSFASISRKTQSRNAILCASVSAMAAGGEGEWNPEASSTLPSGGLMISRSNAARLETGDRRIGAFGPGYPILSGLVAEGSCRWPRVAF
jgi:hypothetical protein